MHGVPWDEDLPWRLLERMAQAAAARAGRAPGRLPLVWHYAREIGRVLGWEEGRLRSLRAAALLHDAGADLLRDLDAGAAAMVRSHREYWDGSGVPHGLRGDAIPEGARILAVAGCLAVFPGREALETLHRGAATIFDPTLVALVGRTEFVRPAASEDSGWLEPVTASSRRDRLLHELILELGNSLSLPGTFGDLGARLHQLVDYDAMVLWVPRGDGLSPAFVQGDAARHFCSLEIPLGQECSGAAALSGQVVYNGDPGSVSFGSAMAVPLQRDGTLVGVLTLYHARAQAFQPADRETLVYLREKLAASAGNALKYESMEKLATQDPATGLPNERALFLRLDAELARCRRNQGSLAVLVCEMGGWGAGLQPLAAGLRRSCREEDFVARMGEGFVLVLDSFPRSYLAEKQKQMERLVAELGPAAGNGIKLGAAFYPDDGAYADDLLAVADARMNLPDREAV